MKLPTAFEERLRYENYNLSPESLVIDCGGYHGEFARRILDTYGPVKIVVFEPIKEFYEIAKEALEFYQSATVINAGVGANQRTEQFGIQGGLTGRFNGGANGWEDVEIIELPVWLWRAGGSVSLLKLNCEGMEFEIIPALIDSNVIHGIKNLQVQFHKLHEDDEQKYQEIREQLLATHELTYDFPWVWQNWRLKQ